MVSTCIVGLLLAVVSFPVWADDSSAEAVNWLAKMGDAVKNRDYQGTFTYMRGSRFDTVRIVHRVEDGVEMERLFNLNGEVREIYRENDRVRCFHPQRDGQDMASLGDHTVQIGPFTPAFSEKVIATQNLYRLSMRGDGRIAGRKAVQLSIAPKNNDRYGYRVWLDEETGLLLQSHLVDRGRVREIFQFTGLEIDKPLTAGDLATAISDEAISHDLTLDISDQPDKPVWRVSWLPDGFRLVRVGGNRLHFSDGLAAFSVFVEPPGSAVLPDMTTTIGGTVVIIRRLQKTGPQVAVVGAVPVTMAQRVAESVEPVIY